MDRTTFVAELKRDGFEVVEREMPANHNNPEHAHDFDARVMDVLLGLMHCWRWSDEPYIPVCRSVGRVSMNCQREISHNPTSGQSSRRRTRQSVGCWC